MKLSALGEFGLIELIQEVIQSSQDPSAEARRRVLIDIGDDAAAWAGSELVQLATTDSLVEDVHFRFSWSSWEDLGHKSLAVNLSDIAAMGGVARYALVALSCPGSVDSDDVLQYYHGMCTLAGAHGVCIIGGNLTSSPFVTSTVFVMGEARADQLLRRSAAEPGQLLAVTGELGRASTALSLLGRPAVDASPRVPQEILTSLLRPEPRLRESLVLVEEGVRCAIDVSDGLVADLGHICCSSGVSASVEAGRVPVCDACAQLWPTARALALRGGEDYELLFTCTEEQFARVRDRLACRVTAIGRIGVAESTPTVTVLDSAGRAMDLETGGWNHFGR